MCRSRLCIILRFSFISAVLYIGCEGLLRRIFFSSLLMFHERVYTWKCRNSSSQTACNCGSTSSFSICVGLFWRQRRQMLTCLTHSCRTGFLFSTISMLLQAIRARIRAEMRMLGHVWEEYHACTTDTLQNGRMEQLEKRLDFSPFLWFIFVLFHIIRATVTEQRTNSSCFEVDGRRGGKYKNAQHKFRLQLFIHLYFAPFCCCCCRLWLLLFLYCHIAFHETFMVCTIAMCVEVGSDACDEVEQSIREITDIMWRWKLNPIWLLRWEQTLTRDMHEHKMLSSISV